MDKQDIIAQRLKLAEDRDFAIMRIETWVRDQRNRHGNLFEKLSNEVMSVDDRYELAGKGLDETDEYWTLAY